MGGWEGEKGGRWEVGKEEEARPQPDKANTVRPLKTEREGCRRTGVCIEDV